MRVAFVAFLGGRETRAAQRVVFTRGAKGGPVLRQGKMDDM